MPLLDIPSELLPTREAVDKIGELELPEKYFGASDKPYLAEIFYNSVKAGREWYNIIIPDLKENYGHEKLMALCKLYAPTTNYTIFHGFNSLTDEKELSTNSIINCLYLAHHYGQSSGIVVSTTLFSLKNSPIIQLDMSETVPDTKTINNYIEVTQWMRNESLSAPIDVTWFIAQNWTKDDLINTLVQGGNMRKIVKLLVIGFRDPEEIKKQLTGDEEALPESWLEQLMDMVE